MSRAVASADARSPSVAPVETARTGLVSTRSTREPPVETTHHPADLASTHSTGDPLVEPVETPAPRNWPDVRDRLGRHPEWLALLAAAAAWGWLALALGWFTPTGAATLLPGHHHGPAGASEAPHSADAQLLIWAAMVIAMMLPTTVPHLRYLGFNTRASRRQRAVALFLLGYLAVWLAPGFVLTLVGVTPSWVLVVAVLIAGAWEWTPLKRRALRRCCRTWPVGYAGASADAAAVEYGLRHGGICLLATGPAMVALMLAGHPWWATAALAVVMAAQKLLSHPERWRTMVAIGWLASGVAVAGSALLQHA